MHATDIDISSVSKTFDDTPALNDVSLRVLQAEIVSVLGPSGCGKTTLLQLLAGHLRPDGGTIAIGGTQVAGDGTWVPASERGVGMVFQDYALFPHLDVAGNVGFGIRGRRERAAVVPALLERYGIAQLAHRFPHQLSGGQQQRVAIVRALAQRPRVLLLDEPFSNLDSSTREHVRGEVVAMLRETGLTCVFVTHDQEEALAISDRVAVMQCGRVLQIDEPEVLYRRPFCREVAEFVGKTNVLRGRARASEVTTEIGTFPLHTPATGDVEIVVRPELLELRPAADGVATVVAREFRGHDVLYTLRLQSGATLLAHRPSVHMAEVGDRVRLEPQPGFASVIDTRENVSIMSSMSEALTDRQAAARLADDAAVVV